LHSKLGAGAGLNKKRKRLSKGSKTKYAASCGSVFVTPILGASANADIKKKKLSLIAA
jgi:hypothetical protein